MAEEILIFNVGDESARMKVGKSYLLLGVAASEKEARALMESLPINAGSKVVLAVKQAVLRRVPAVRLEDVDERLIEPSSSKKEG
jgi:hypothetical protein